MDKLPERTTDSPLGESLTCRRGQRPEAGQKRTPGHWGHEENQGPREQHSSEKIEGIQDGTGGQRCKQKFSHKTPSKIATKTSWTDWRKTIDCSIGKVLAEGSAHQQLQGGQLL